ncbi:MAG TPA: hypothetical protein VF824_17800 [Thermoanaerobaculia bacterium]
MRSVAVVLDPDFGDRLDKLAFRLPVWVVDSPPNRIAAENAWRASLEWPHITVTIFRALPDHPTREHWAELLEMIALHEPYDAVEVVGAELTLPARSALLESGFTRFESSARGFRARKP